MSAVYYLPAGIHKVKRLTAKALLTAYRAELVLGTNLSALIALENWTAYSSSILPECIASVRNRRRPS